jgi:putative CocE/NonD family hydrolase
MRTSRRRSSAHLHGKGEKPAEGHDVPVGTNRWRTYSNWPPSGSKPTNVYLACDGTLTFEGGSGRREAGSGRTEAASYREYVSDPANPVPYRQRPISPTYPNGDWRTWETADQRFVEGRPDVLTWVSAPLDKDLTITGQVSADLFASTSGTDADFVVKLIDVYPENAEKTPWNPDNGPNPGAFARTMNGYELPIAMEIRRGRYLESYEKPSALKPNVPIDWKIPLRDRDHVFLKGHRLMVQVQSTWFR